MNWKSLFSWEVIRQQFDWTPISVRPPRARYGFYSDIGKMLLGYEVEVEYLYHGNKKKLFAVDEEKLGLVSKKRALARAIAFYKLTMAEVRAFKKGRKECR